MGYQNLESVKPEGSWRLGTVAAAVVMGVALGLAMPAGPALAGVGSGSEASTSTAAKTTDGTIVVADNWKKKNKNWNKNWNKKNVVVVRPYRKWNRRPYYGTVIGGIALGTVLGAAAYSAAPPAPNLCWYWADPAQTQGYWDYCY